MASVEEDSQDKRVCSKNKEELHDYTKAMSNE